MMGERKILAGVVVLIAAGAVSISLGIVNPSELVGRAFAVARGLDPPDLSDPVLQRRGGGHYDLVCSHCHASPDRPSRGRHLALTPPAPVLHLTLHGWPPESMFTRVRGGINHSGMPAWPSAVREDEVWAVTAFLTELPGMNPETYRDLTGISTDTNGVPVEVIRCVRCHEADGRGRGDRGMPRLDLQSVTYLQDALTAFRDGRRASGFMQSAATGLTDAEISLMANYFSREEEIAATKPSAVVDPAPIPERVAVCTSCHGTTAPVRDAIPRIAGQDESYLAKQLSLFLLEDQPRGGGPFANLMHQAVRGLSADDVNALARYFAGLPVN